MTKEEILAELSQSRAAVRRDYGALRTEMDVTARLNQMVRRKPLAWLGGAAALGWLLAGPKTKTRVVTKHVRSTGKPSRKEEKKAAPRAGLLALLIGLVRFAVPILKPVFSAYATRRFAEIAERLAK